LPAFGAEERVAQVIACSRNWLVDAIGCNRAGCDLFVIRSTSHWTGAAIIGKGSRTKSCIVTRRKTSPRFALDEPAVVGRCPPLWPGDLRTHGGSISASVDRRNARLDGTLPSHNRRGKEVRRVEHPGPGRLERGAPARGSGNGRSAAEASFGTTLCQKYGGRCRARRRERT